MTATIDNTINWAFTAQLIFASAAFVALCALALIFWQIWKETRE